VRFRALATDFDGTLADGGAPDPDALDAIGRARADGMRVVLVTGRILSELLVVFPDVFDHVDSVVAENGAVLATRSGTQVLHPPMDDRLVPSLAARGVQLRQGLVLVACAGLDEPTILEVVRDLGLECELLRNRHELMILPTGVTKGSGLVEALAQLGASPHDTLGVGDAENDHSLLETVEVGVAVANAVPSLAHQADLVLEEADGLGLAGLLESDIVHGSACVHSARWQVRLGTGADGVPATVPASHVNILVGGGSGDGKSWVTGLICEQLVRLGYSLLVIDPEGDHAGLADLPEVMVVGGDRSLPPADMVVSLIDWRCGTVVVDLSALEEDGKDPYLRSLGTEIARNRATTGLPHWVVLDEAHRGVGRQHRTAELFDPFTRGNCLVTWHPEDLAAPVLAATDIVIAPTSPHAGTDLADLAAAVAGVPRLEALRALSGPRGSVLVTRRDQPGRVQLVELAPRMTSHFRHEHKYAQEGVGSERAFHFRDGADHLTGATAASLTELETELRGCSRSTLRHHMARHDLSRWVADVFHDPPLAAALENAEDGLEDDSPDAAVERARSDALRSLRER
jgi:hydroxymethylpyrimidine pyrophosphatase-like HAD family hydrolase